MSRRRFLGGSGAALAGLGLAGCADDGEEALPESRPPGAEPDVYCAVGFFTRHEALTVEALTARILPGTPDDPGAREAGAVNYIDCLLTTSEGFSGPTYRDGPFPPPLPEEERDIEVLAGLDLPPLVFGGEPDAEEDLEQGGIGSGLVDTSSLRDDAIEATGYGVIPLPKQVFDRYGNQSALAPSELYRRGLRHLDRHCRSSFDDPFVDLTEDQQDEVVGDLADDAIDAFDVPSAEGFFELVRQHVIEGVFGDPIYGGNRDFAGWRLIDYPGAYRAWTPEEVRTPGFRRPPQGIADMHRFNPGHAERDEPVLPVAGRHRAHED